MFFAVIFFGGVVFAWFVFNDVVGTNGWGVDFTDDTDRYLNILKIFVNDDGEYKPVDETLEISPGQYKKFKFEVKNDTDANVQYKLMFGYVKSSYPAYTSERNYSSFISDLFEYSEDEPGESVPYDPGAVNSAKAKSILSALSEPIANAVSFYYGNETLKYLDSIVDGKYTIDKTKLTPFHDERKVFSGTEDYKTCERASVVKYPSESSATDETDPWIVVPANDTLTLYFSLYFDGEYTTKGTYDGKTLQMRNSNAFLGQILKIAISLLGVE